MNLIVAYYNHTNYVALTNMPSEKDSYEFKIPNPAGVPYTLKSEARDTAARLFGASGNAYENVSKNIPPDQPLQSLFTFLDAFEYYKIPKNFKYPASDVSLDADTASKMSDMLYYGVRYGWTALVTDEQLAKLKPKIGWPNSPFCTVFDIQIIPLADDFKGAWENNSLSDKAWKKLGRKVYKHQTPASWGH
jgi:hypothetical protein